MMTSTLCIALVLLWMTQHEAAKQQSRQGGSVTLKSRATAMPSAAEMEVEL